jgi:hypothetical protein
VRVIGWPKAYLTARFSLPDGMRWLDPLEHPMKAAHILRIYDPVTDMMVAREVPWWFLQGAMPRHCVIDLVWTEMYGAVTNLLMYRPWGNVIKLVQEIKSAYFWEEQRLAQLEEDRSMPGVHWLEPQ